jgi:hypothetical protein
MLYGKVEVAQSPRRLEVEKRAKGVLRKIRPIARIANSSLLAVKLTLKVSKPVRTLVCCHRQLRNTKRLGNIVLS